MTGRVVVGVPAYNEESAIAGVVAGARKHADVVLVCDDGSWDRTAELARAAGAVVIRHRRNVGVGGAMQTLLMWARAHTDMGDVFVTIDGDGQHDPADIPALVAALAEGRGYDVVNGTRAPTPSHERWVRVLNRLAGWATRRLTGYEVTDSETGFRAHRGWVVQKLFFRSTDYGWNAEALLKLSQLGARLKEVPVRMEWGVVSPGHRRRGLRYGLFILVRLVAVKRGWVQAAWVADVQATALMDAIRAKAEVPAP